MKICEKSDCSNEIPPQKGSARPRKYCIECSPPRNRKNPRVISLPTPLAADVPDDGGPQLVKTYRIRLEQVGRLDSPEGEHVMLLARLLAAGQGHTAAGAASLSRELRAAMEVAERGAPQQGDKLDELAERRAAKVASA